MENLLHSLQHSKLPKKPAHAPKSIYDDVFGGPPKYGGVPTLSPRVEDYGEIFGGFRTPRSSAIPVLDLPVVNGPDMFFDVRSSEFDYSEVFGQCEGLDFADAGEVLFGRQSNGGDYGSSDEAWTPEASEYLSEESEHSENNHYFETGDGYYPVDNNVSYNRANSRCNSEIPNGIRHAAQIHSVPGFSYFVDQRAKVQNQADSNPSAWHAHDSSRDLYFGREMAKAKGRHLKKTVSNLSDTKTFRESYENDVRPQRVNRRRNSCPRETFVTISEVSLRTEPSNVPPPLRPAPALDIKVGDAGGLGSSWKGISPEGAEFDDSPRFFDVEIDASSSAAAASAAAMKEVMEQAQAKLKSAKELMEQKKEFAPDHIKVVSRDDSKKLSRRLSKIVDGVNSSRKVESVQAAHQRDSSVMINYETLNAIKPTPGIPDMPGRAKDQNVLKRSTELGRRKEVSSSQIPGHSKEPAEWEEAAHLFELARSGISAGALEHASNRETVFLQNAKVHDNGQSGIEVGLEAFERQENGKKTNVGREAHRKKDLNENREQIGNDGKQKAGKVDHRQKEHEKEDKTSINVASWQNKTSIRLESAQDLMKYKSLGKIETQMSEFHVRHGTELREDRKHLKEERERVRNEDFEEVCSMVDNGRTRNQAFDLEKRRRGAAAELEEIRDSGMMTFEGTRNDWEKEEADEKEEKEKRLEAALQEQEEEKKMKEHQELKEKGRLKEAREKEESERRMRKVFEKQEKDRRLREAYEQEENDRRLKEALEKEEKDKRLREAREQEESERRQREALEKEENDRRLTVALEQEENERRLREALEKEENDRRLRVALELEENERRLKEALEKEENDRRLRAALEQEENERRLKEVALEKEENDRRLRAALEQEENERRLKEVALEKEENDRRLRAALDQEENERRLKEALKKEEKDRKLREACEQEENERRLKEALEKEEKEKMLREALEREEKEKKLKEALEIDKNEKRQVEARQREESGKALRISSGRETTKNGLDKSRAIESNEKCMEEAFDLPESHKVPMDVQEEEIKASSDEEVLQEQMDSVLKDNIEFEVINDTLHEVSDVGELSGLTENHKQALKDQMWKQDSNKNICSDAVSRKCVENLENWKTEEESTQEGNIFLRNDLDSEKKPMAAENRKLSEDERGEVKGNIKLTSTQAANEGGNGRQRTESSRPDLLNLQKTAQQQNASHLGVWKEKNANNTTMPASKNAERLRKEQELEKERLRKLEEEREREREREKDRMAVDRATLEARERVYSEARERAERAALERATAEARQKAMMEARQRLEKACAEAQERTFSEKSSTEARLRAERAAVERATAEARERAAERAVAEKATTDRFSAPRYNGMRESSQSSDVRPTLNHGAGSLDSTRYPYSSGYNSTYEAEISERVEGESAQRCRARLERHRRTAERAAKALAEKNMRDLLALREQAERNRLAESLDADVKRWSSGKEGNLRALLSTLQYILGPESGWQPIPLTEVITSAAVKKAYRKATLCVHPDKLQQRGASIQQKYICEKVFDLLKEAWNKFNSEER